MPSRYHSFWHTAHEYCALHYFYLLPHALGDAASDKLYEKYRQAQHGLRAATGFNAMPPAYCRLLPLRPMFLSRPQMLADAALGSRRTRHKAQYRVAAATMLECAAHRATP